MEIFAFFCWSCNYVPAVLLCTTWQHLHQRAAARPDLSSVLELGICMLQLRRRAKSAGRRCCWMMVAWQPERLGEAAILLQLRRRAKSAGRIIISLSSSINHIFLSFQCLFYIYFYCFSFYFVILFLLFIHFLNKWLKL